MGLKELKKSWKKEVTDVLAAFAVVLIAYFSFNHFKPSIEEMFLPVIFLLVLILLQFADKK